MSREMMLGMLRAGSNGEQLLQILNTLVEDVTNANIANFVEYAVDQKMSYALTPTLSEVAF